MLARLEALAQPVSGVFFPFLFRAFFSLSLFSRFHFFCPSWLTVFPLFSLLFQRPKRNRSHFAAHVRSHFFCNVGVAAGLLLTRSFGGGVFAADRVLGRKKSR